MSIQLHTPLEECHKTVFEGAVLSDFTHDVEVTSDASNDFCRNVNVTTLRSSLCYRNPSVVCNVRAPYSGG